MHHLDPLRASRDDVRSFRRLLEARGLQIVVETGARFVLDPRRKHRPSLLDPPHEAARRLELLFRCADLAHDLGAPVVTVWSGSGPAGLDPAEARRRLVEGLRRLSEHAARRGVRVGFEPEPGMAVERTDGWPPIRDAVGHEALGLTLDVGHVLAMDEGDPADLVRAHAADLLVIQLDDHVRGVHDHRAFGDGEIDFRRVAAAVAETGFSGPLEVELSRHSATAPATAADAIGFLRRTFSGL